MRPETNIEEKQDERSAEESDVEMKSESEDDSDDEDSEEEEGTMSLSSFHVKFL